ncbi:unnamed protein product [Enterobius vermicularis]|uniref:Autophagy-related protein 9 n=1 Tax=Enterobius vermicularis TaxID=51028 RepID=A0A0N4V525_ENTVE|nr:unnamed protein product [Enterobius vermicularis]
MIQSLIEHRIGVTKLTSLIVFVCSVCTLKLVRELRPKYFDYVVEIILGERPLFTLILDGIQRGVCSTTHRFQEFLKKVEVYQHTFTPNIRNIPMIAVTPPSTPQNLLGSKFWLDDDYINLSLNTIENMVSKIGIHSSAVNFKNKTAFEQPYLNTENSETETSLRDEEGEFWLEDSYGLHEQERLVKSLLAKDDSEFLLCEQELLKNSNFAVTPSLLNDALERKMLIDATNFTLHSSSSSTNSSQGDST